tara:strand:- start:6 stop:965 length:960 start_codon:yes stop_codon:yes gene_type:complete
MHEHKIIKKYLKPLSTKDQGAMNLNDDIYYDKNNKISISVDTYVEGIHFLDSNDPKKFLKKVLRASLSDLICKGVKPKSYFLSFAIPKNLAKTMWLKEIKKILSNEQKKFGITLSGGDTVQSSKFIISIIVLGFPYKKPVFRNSSRINDDIYVTGNLGDSFIGLNIIKKKNNFGKLNSFFTKKYYEPDLQTKLIPHLYNIATSSIDISDGLGQDLQHLCNNSKCGAEIFIDLLPVSHPCNKLILQKKIKLTKIFSKGDDYNILFTSPFNNRSKIKNLSKKTKVKITRIGTINKVKNINFKYNGKNFTIRSKNMGYTHNF